MKKLLIILFAVVSFNAASAQQRDSHEKYNTQDSRKSDSYGKRAHSNDYAYNENSRYNDDHDRRQEMDRMHQQPDRRDDHFRNEPSVRYDANRPVYERREMQPVRPSFGTGVVVGAAAVLLGVLIGH